MEFFADLHIHSPFSRATSKSGDLFGLAAWATVKGVQVVGTGDFTHPGWLERIVSDLEEAEPGFFKLRQQPSRATLALLPPGIDRVDTSGIRFVLTAEISSIYKREGRVRKVHNILFAPDIPSVQCLNATLSGIGNLEADGRPILGLDSEHLLEIMLEKNPEGFLVPAHVWTPWFSLFGSKSGFDRIEDCFGALSEHIFALETGLSSDPAMNRCLSSLDRFTLISNSDCHSPGKLGREANYFDTEFDYFAMREAIRRPRDARGKQVFLATVEFFPEEGKYHCDGHRACGICWEPAESRKQQNLCPVCHKPLTIGVLNRVMELADRPEGVFPEGAPGVHSLIPLAEVLGELYDVGPMTKKVQQVYGALIREFGSEFFLLLQAGIDDIAARASAALAEAIKRMRQGRVICQPGYDGEYGVIRLFSDQERAELRGQVNLFGQAAGAAVQRTGKSGGEKKAKQQVVPKAAKDFRNFVAKSKANAEQLAVIQDQSPYILVSAGPGTGKTSTLVQRVARLLLEQDIPCTVITFTNKAADSVRQRLATQLQNTLDGQDWPQRCTVATFHAYCLDWLHQAHPALRPASPALRQRILRELFANSSAREAAERELSSYLHNFTGKNCKCPASLLPYFRRLDQEQLVDLDAVVPLTIALLDSASALSTTMRARTGALFIDEFQDINLAQHTLVSLLARTSPVFAIGDPDQSIYGFRDSRPDLFFRFAREQDAVLHHLQVNYRNSPVILQAAGQLIAHNPLDEQRVSLQTGQTAPGQLRLRACSTAQEEAEWVAESVEGILGGTSHRSQALHSADATMDYSLRDIAVLYRTGRQGAGFAEAFAKRGIPFQLVDLQAFYQEQPVRPLYLWILVCSGQAEQEQFLELLGLEQGMGKGRLAEVEAVLPDGRGTLLEWLTRQHQDLSAISRATLSRLGRQLGQWKALCHENGMAANLAPVAAHYGIGAGDQALLRFSRLALQFGHDLAAFAAHLLGNQDQVVYDERAEAVTLITLHAAKGLEYSVVFLTGLEEGILPLQPRHSLESEQEAAWLEEERRLVFVGMTRASRQLHCSWAASRPWHGQILEQRPSRFLQEFDPSLLQAVARSNKVKKARARQLRLF